MKASSLRTRLIVASIAWLAMALLAGGMVLRFAFTDSVERAFQQRLTAILRALTAAIDVTPEGIVRLARPIGDPRFDQAYSGWYWQVSNHQSLARSRSLWDFDLPTISPAEPGNVHFGMAAGPRGEGLITAERDLTFPAFATPLHVTIAASRDEIDHEIAGFDRLLLVSFLGLGAGLVAAVWWQVGYGLKPLRRLAGELERLRGQPAGRLEGPYPAEVAPLADALNAVLDHDAKLVERARTHVGNLAHGLKTPLAVLKVELATNHTDRSAMTAQIERMARLIDHQLARASAEAGSARAIGTRVPVADVVHEIAAVLARVYAERGIALYADCPAEATFPGDREDLAEMVGNLMENACKWASTRVLVMVLTKPGLTLLIEDDGPGLTAEQCTEATGRGIRLDESAPGHGLGLAIVRDLSHLYGGTLSLERSALGGVAARLHFPA
jgi:signal transduction histidine kinase